MPSPNWFHPIDYADVVRLRAFDADARWLFIETFCGELGAKTGLVICRPVLIAAECGLPIDRVLKALRALHDGGMIVWCEESRTAYHVGSLVRHPPTNPKHKIGWSREIAAFADGLAKTRAIAELDGYAEPIDSLSEPYRYHAAQEQEQEQEQEPGAEAPSQASLLPKVEDKAPSKRKTFTKPTEAEVRDAFIAKGVHPSLAAAKATEFIGHYESNGWRVGKNPMRSWQGAVQTWFGRLRADGKLEGAARAMPAKPDPKLGRDDVWV
jgi:hypothetical protein